LKFTVPPVSALLKVSKLPSDEGQKA